MPINAPEIAVIGGGTGSFTLLQELKEFTPNITAIVNMSDDGGNSGELRDELGVLPPGDVRQCLVALSNLPEVRDLFGFRFPQGKYGNLSAGNLILSALEIMHVGDYERTIQVASTMLNVTGKVVPVTLENHRLVMHDGDEVIKGEHRIGHRKINNRDAYVALEPKVTINAAAKSAITDADIVVIAPGNLYGSLLPALTVDGMQEAFAQTRARKVVVSNLVNKPGQTDDWHAVDYVHVLEKYIGEGQVDVIMFNNAPPTPELLETYAQQGELPLDVHEQRFQEVTARAIGACLVAKEVHKQDSNDTLIRRTLIRHDAHQVGKQLMKLFYE